MNCISQLIMAASSQTPSFSGGFGYTAQLGSDVIKSL